MPFRFSPPFAGRTAPPRAVVAALDSSPYVYACQWQDDAFGEKYSDPATTGITEGQGVKFSPAGNHLLLGGLGTRANSWEWNDWTGFGTRTTLTLNNPVDFAFNDVGDELIVALLGSGNELASYAFDESTGVGAKRTNPSGVPDNSRAVTFLPPNSSRIASYGEPSSAPNIRIMTYSDGFTSNVAHGRSNVVYGNSLAVGPAMSDGTYPLAFGYAFTGNNGFGVYRFNGTTISEFVPAANQNTTYLEILFDKRGNLILCGFLSPYVSIYPLTPAGLGARLSNPASTVLPSPAISACYDPIDDILFVGHASSPYLRAYQLGPSGIVSRFSDPPTLPTSAINGLTFI